MLCVQWCVCLIDVENELTNGNIISYYVLKYTSDYNIKLKLRGFSLFPVYIYKLANKAPVIYNPYNEHTVWNIAT